MLLAVASFAVACSGGSVAEVEPSEDLDLHIGRLDQELFHAARALPPADRAAFLARSTASDAKLSALVERLLARHTDAQVLDRPVLELGPAHDARSTLLP